MHVLVIPSWYPSHEYPTNGIFFRRQAHGLRGRGMQVGVVAPVQFAALHLAGELRHSRRLSVEDDDGIPTYGSYTCGWFPLLERANNRLWLRRGRRLVSRYMAEHGRPDVIHAQVATQAGLLAVWVKQRFDIPYVLSEHTSLYLEHRIAAWRLPGLREAFAGAAARTVVSPQLGEAVERYLGRAAQPWIWVPNLVDRRFYESALASGRNRAGAFTFLHVASLDPIKRQEDLLRAFGRQFKGAASVQLRIGGDGPMGSRLRRLTDSLGIGGQVRFLGPLSRDDVLEEMRRCDIFVLSSGFETFSIVLAEALACGKPVISTACGGPQCIVTETNGILVPVGDPDMLGQAMNRMRQSRLDYDDQAIREDCIRRFGEASVLDRLAELLHDAAAGSKGQT
ncbi:MAG: glycosyltransferase [Anaerolineaceae bacterium]|nr:glycosyltransferase [Anaerolineaceae bacterium]